MTTNGQNNDATRVLLVEDSPSDARLIRHGLSHAQGVAFELVVAERLDVALAKLRLERFDVVLLDLGLPDTTGIETFTRVQMEFPQLPIVVMTGADDDADGVEAIRLGVQDYLVKGKADSRTVTRAIRYSIERKRGERALRELNETLEQRVAERTSEIHRQAAQLRALAVDLTQAEQIERQRLAQVLHDHIQQLLVASKIQLGITAKLRDEATRDQSIERVSALVQESIEACRSLTVELSPPVLQQAGLGAGLAWLATRMGRQSQLEVQVEADPEAEPQNEIVALHLFDCARELLLNVLKHSGVRRAKVLLTRAAGGWTQLVVEDEGSGFDPGMVSASAEHGGFGLFSIQQRLRHMGGRVDVDTAAGRGTRIAILMPPPSPVPLAEADTPLPAARKVSPEPRSPRARPSAQTTRIRLLLADDHKILRQGLAALLQMEEDIEVVGEAADGQEAVELARRLRPDVVIMDVSMPRINGLEATRTILAELPDTKVIALSMHAEGDMAAAMREAGAIAYLTKGGPSDSLIAAIREKQAV